MKVVLVHDSALEWLSSDDMPEDFGAEYDEQATVEALLEALRSRGHCAEAMVFGTDFADRVREAAPEMVFNIAEGARGPVRESLVPGWLDHLGIPYTGSDGLTLALTLDKALAKELVRGAGIPTPPFRRVECPEQVEGLDLEFPLFVKPNSEGSSMGIRCSSRCESPDELRRQVKWVLDNYRQDCLVEEFAPGPEFCVGMVGNAEPQLFPVLEVRPPGKFYSYEHKSIHRKELHCPAEVSPELADEMKEIGLRAWRLFRCRDLARVDLKLDGRGRPLFLEINPLPGLSPEYSIYPRQAREAGLSHGELIGHIVECAAERAGMRRERMSR